MQDAIKKSRNSPDSKAPKQKRVRLSPPLLPQAAGTPVPTSLPPLPPLRSITQQNSPASTASAAPSNAHKLAGMRRKYLDDISMVIQELKAVLTFGPGSACPDAPVPASVVLKLVRTVQTLEKLRGLLLMHPARLRRVSLAQLETVEQQIKTNLLPLATLFRSFEGDTTQESSRAASPIGDKMEQDWSHHCDTTSPRSPSGAAVTPLPQHDWRFLSMALSLQL
ncbi:hypothetical protein KRP22_008563 [Phytophthora ramorum]|uniref:Uncharacterized protein n=1 Tax=Phytophthora ramorum TaxID=164328 RepID=H3GTM7_PHYRM|nr:hypothetical protein KRP23_2738 [Phytophthora ramorum]KAH7501922.1 hypothetical protein KRP22_7396 [Phytophthora ramorum]